VHVTAKDGSAAITLPSHVIADAIEATARDGVLQILVPKSPRLGRVSQLAQAPGKRRGGQPR
jgi:HSP20 family molecular chaperone IbpA